MNKKVSIVIPCYNAHLYLKDLLLSILKQTYRDFCEVIIVENGSTSESIVLLKEIIKEYEDKLNIQFAQSDKASVSEARNKGMEMATGDYITFIDADDTFAGKGSIEYRVDYLNVNPDFDVIAGYAIKMDKVGTIEPSRAPEDVEILYRRSHDYPLELPKIYMDYYLLRQKLYFYITGSALIRLDKLRVLNIKFDPNYDRIEDVEFNISLFEKNLKFFLAKVPFYIKRSHDNHLSKTITQDLEDKVLVRMREVYNKLGLN